MSNVNSGGLDEYNPFANNSNYGTTDLTKQQEPATLQTSSNANAALEELERRQRELDDRARALDAKEREQSQSSTSNTRPNNFPPLPNCCPIKPCFHQDFEQDFSPGKPKSLVKLGYYIWLFYSFTMTVNMVVAFFNFFSSADALSERGAVFGQALIYFFIFIPLSFVLWYKPLYDALRIDSSARFFIFFAFFGIQIVILAIQTLGITYFGAFGWLVSIAKLTASNNNKALSITMIVTACLFTISLVLVIYLILQVHAFYRNSGASFDKARSEIGRSVVSNETMRQAAGDITLAAAKNAAAPR